jgi:hypothetical protein
MGSVVKWSYDRLVIFIERDVLETISNGVFLAMVLF